jgi:hypothetical protein
MGASSMWLCPPLAVGFSSMLMFIEAGMVHVNAIVSLQALSTCTLDVTRLCSVCVVHITRVHFCVTSASRCT